MIVALSEFGEPAVHAAFVMAPTVPFAGPATIENVSSHWFGSVAVNVTTTPASSFVVTVLFAAVGATFTTPLNVTVRVPPGPMTAEHGFVVPVHVFGERSAWPLHPPNVEPTAGVARNAIDAPLVEVVMFGAQVLVTV